MECTPSPVAGVGKAETRNPTRRQLLDQAQATHRIALVVARPPSEQLFAELMLELSATLGVAAAFVSTFSDSSRRRLRTLAMCLDGTLLPDLEYDVAGSPCENVLGHRFRFVPCGVLAQIDPRSDFAAAGLDAYAAFPINDSHGTPLGVVAVMHRQLIAGGDAAHTEVLLKIVAARLASELERRDTLAVMQRAAMAVSAAHGATVFDELVRLLATLLGLEYAFIARADPADPDHLNLLALHADGCITHDLRYPLASSPCRHVLGQQFRAFPSGVALQFPDDSDVLRKGAEGYAGHPLTGPAGQPLGVIAVGSRQPLVDVGRIEAMLKIFAVRAATEVERLGTDEALRRSVASYHAIFDNAADAILVLDWDSFALCDANQTACEAYGYTRDELLAVDPAQLTPGVPPYDMAHVLDHLRQARLGRSRPFEWQARLKDGRLLWQEIRLRPVQIDGQPRILAFARDISERKAAEEQLRLSEEQYRAIFDASADALMLWNSQLQRVDVNPAHQRIFGFAREDVVGRGFEDLPYPPEHVEPRIEMVRRALAGEHSRAELDALRKDGRQIVTELRTIPFVHRGEPHVLQIARDITERKAAEERLRDSEAQYRAIFNASADALILWNSQFVRVDVNPAYERMYGWSRAEVIGVGYEHMPDADAYARPRRELVRRSLAGETAVAELEAVRKDGSRVMTEVTTIPFTHRGEPHVLAIVRDLTERKKAEAALRASEAQYRAIFNASVDALTLWDSRMRRVDVNDAYLRMYGWQRRDVIGRGHEHLPFGEDYYAPRQDLVRRALAGETCRAELESIRKDGGRIMTEIQAIPFTHRGEPHVLTIGRDLTERKKAEAQLRAREELHRAIFDGSVDAMVLYDSTLRMVDVNTAFANIRGCSRGELVGQTWNRRPDADDFEPLLPLIDQALAGREVATVKSIAQAGRNPIDMELRYLPVRIGGEAYALGIGRNVTQRLEHERELQRSAARLSATVDAAFDCVIGMDGEGRIVEFNAAAERVFGHRRAQVLGQELAALILPERHRMAHRRGLKHFRPGGAGTMLGRLVETTAQTADGREIPVEMAISEARVPEGSIFVGHLRDISARRAAEAERAQLEAQLRQAQKMEAIGQLTGGIAHDFNNILTSVLGYVVLAQERAEALGDARIARQLGQAQLATGRARDLVTQMLAFARRQTGTRQPMRPINLLRESAELLRSTLPSSVLLDIDVSSASSGLINGDAGQLGQVFLNLGINARDAVNGRGQVRLAARDAGGGWHCQACGLPAEHERWVELTVSDNGCGIPRDTMRRMFEPFFTTKPAGSGSGMGLAMVHGIVHDHGGHIVVDTELGQGTTFRVLMPRCERPETAPVVTGATPSASGTAPLVAALQGSLLVVEDDVQVGDYLRERLEAWGIDVVLLHDPRAALAWLRDGANRVQVLLTDLTMPHVSGLALAGEARRLRPGLPVLLISADLASVDAAALAAAGVAATLAKPIDPHALRSTLQATLKAGSGARDPAAV